MIDTTSKSFGSIFSTINTKTNSAKTSASNNASAMNISVSNSTNSMYQSTAKHFEAIYNTANTKTNSANNLVNNNINRMSTGVSSSMKKMVSSTSTEFANICNTANSKSTDIKNSVNDNINQMGSGVGSTFNNLKQTISTHLSTLLDTIDGQHNNWSGSGGYLVEGIRDGLSSKWSNTSKTGLVGKIVDLASGLTSALKKAFGIKSPSRVWRDEVGYYLTAGLALGITNNTDRVTNALDDLVDDMNDVMSNADIVNPLSNFDTEVINIPNVNLGSISGGIPALAQGAVIPANKQFLAVLGDQKNGTNIETPLETMVEAFNQALDNRGSANNNQPIVLQLNSRVIAKAIWDENQKKYKQTGNYR
jgi:hypothetical protein